MTNSKIARSFCFIIAALIAFSSLVFSVNAADNAVVSIANASGKAGETVTVSVDLSQNPGIIAMELNVAFDSSKLELVSASDAGKLNGYGSSSSYEGSSYTLYWEDGIATANNSATGTIATMTFKLKENCDKADVSISGVGYDTDLNTVNVSASGGTITNTEATTAPTTTKPTTTNPTTTKPTTTKPSTTKKTSTTKKATTTKNNIVEFETEEIISTSEESTTDFLSLFETTTEESTTEAVTEESTTEPEDEGGSTLSRTKIILIILMACFAIVGVAVIVSMVRKTKRG